MTNFIDKTHGVRIKRDVRYATARVNVSTKPVERELLLDVYQPEDLAAGTRSPALVRANAVRFGVDPHRLALGGFSAGARTALNVAYGERVPVSAVVSISGFMGPDDLTRHVTGEGQPPVLLFSGEHDLDYIAKSFAGTAAYFRAKGLLHGAHVVPTVDHFYPATSTIPLLDGKTTTVEGVMAEFFATYLARVDHARAPSARI